MSHNSFDDAVLSRFDDGATAHHDNGISINSLTTNDFKDYNISRRTDPISAAKDDFIVTGKLPELVRVPGFKEPFDPTYIGIQDSPFDRPFNKPFSGLRPGLSDLPTIDFGDRPTKYPLPHDAVVLGGETALSQLNQRITNKAVAKVQESMTPAEKQQLNKDADKYAEAMRKHEEEMKTAMMQHFFRRPEDWPKPPEKPQSLVKYEEAIDREIERLAKRATA